jgi:O-antigen/teichoic acid export membrane protein
MKAIDGIRAALTKVFGRSGPLVLSRVTSFAVGLGLPLVLVRLLEPAQYGAYKQFFLVGMTVLLIGQIGMTQSLFYFVPRGGPQRGVYVAQTLTVLAGLGIVLGASLWVLAPQIGTWLGSPDLASLRLPLAIYGGAMLAAAPLEGSLISDGRVNGAAFAFTSSDLVRTVLMVAAAKLLGGHWLFWAAALLATLRVMTLWILVLRGVLPFARPQRSALRAQLDFALPFAGASLLLVAMQNFSQYAVSASFDPATFALFTVASFHMPVVDIVFNPICEVLMVELGRPGVRESRAVALGHWHEAMDRLSSILFPAACGAWLIGPFTLPLLFTHRYEAAVPLFMVTTFGILLATLPVDALLRAGGETHFLFRFNFVRLVATVTFVLGGVKYFGLKGAIIGSLVSETGARVVMLLRGRRFFGGPLRDLFDWPALGEIAGASAFASVPTYLLRFFLRPTLPAVGVSVAVYGVLYLGARWAISRARRRSAPASAPLSGARPRPVQPIVATGIIECP